MTILFFDWVFKSVFKSQNVAEMQQLLVKDSILSNISQLSLLCHGWIGNTKTCNCCVCECTEILILIHDKVSGSENMWFEKMGTENDSNVSAVPTSSYISSIKKCDSFSLLRKISEHTSLLFNRKPVFTIHCIKDYLFSIACIHFLLYKEM